MDRSERAFRLRVGEVGIGILVRERTSFHILVGMGMGFG